MCILVMIQWRRAHVLMHFMRPLFTKAATLIKSPAAARWNAISRQEERGDWIGIKRATFFARPMKISHSNVHSRQVHTQRHADKLNTPVGMCGLAKSFARAALGQSLLIVVRRWTAFATLNWLFMVIGYSVECKSWKAGVDVLQKQNWYFTKI
jgi:hypothetical protein